MPLRVFAGGLEEILARFSGLGIGERGGDRLAIRTQSRRGRKVALPFHVQLGFAVELSRVARRGQAIRLPGDAAQPKLRLHWRGERFSVRTDCDELNRQRISFLQN